MGEGAKWSKEIVWALSFSVSEEKDGGDSKGPTTCTHIFSLYIIPNILHLLAYLMGFVHFRIRANEDLDSLMEKVFLYCEATYTRHVSQKLLIRKLKSYLYFLVFWTFFAVAVHILCDIVTLRDKVPLIDNISNPWVKRLICDNLLTFVDGNGWSEAFVAESV